MPNKLNLNIFPSRKSARRGNVNDYLFQLRVAF